MEVYVHPILITNYIGTIKLKGRSSGFVSQTANEYLVVLIHCDLKREVVIVPLITATGSHRKLSEAKLLASGGTVMQSSSQPLGGGEVEVEVGVGAGGGGAGGVEGRNRCSSAT